MYKSTNEKAHMLVSRAVASRTGGWFLVVWSFLEASFWFIAPDFLLGIFGALRPKEKNLFFIKAFAASFVGGIFYYIITMNYFEVMQEILVKTPFVTEKMFTFITKVYESYGVLGVLAQSFSFMSFKIWTHLAVAANFNPLLYFLLVMLSRSVRLYLVLFLAAKVGERFSGFIKKHVLLTVFMYSVIFISLLVILE